ncbi:cystatin-B-like isoform X2 [Megalobrama amblycephala]|uniref:cystatin-B-like isoform X2 n=1 Tax=Megalobrama amblycephala TaxID=75352 RepID=UPI002013DCC3|nr:cystatin-B-like isoform X2 [Megalobrama amblycephala]
MIWICFIIKVSLVGAFNTDRLPDNTVYFIQDLITSTMNTECGVGAWTTEKVVTPEEKKICHEVKSDIEKMVGANLKAYIPLSFRIQIVAGTKHLVKVYIGVDKCVHAMITQALPCDGGKLTVTGVQHPKTASEPLIPFDD